VAAEEGAREQVLLDGRRPDAASRAPHLLCHRAVLAAIRGVRYRSARQLTQMQYERQEDA